MIHTLFEIKLFIQLGTRSYYDSPLAVVTKSSSIDERKNGDYEETEHTSHRMPTYLDSRSGRVKLTNANLIYHSADKGYFNSFSKCICLSA